MMLSESYKGRDQCLLIDPRGKFLPFSAGNFYRYLDGPRYYIWFDTLRLPVILGDCEKEKIHWKHDPRLILSKSTILKQLDKWRENINKDLNS
ncbi:unnamed protein product [Haemonchus placei]|uniref:Uncharacterized protein n=1 Tax=Haemonchus placei TaxID=6290 RepID=A0A0N4XBE8_HAEPC|nr:unnamed protein product [Haemonchus placei]